MFSSPCEVSAMTSVFSPASLPCVSGDPLVQVSPPGTLWSRGNSAEAAPGALTALNYSFYGHLSEIHVRRALAGLGVIPRSAAVFHPDAGDRFTAIFHGRLAMNVDVFRVLFSGLPGVTGDQVERDILGSARAGVVDHGYGGRLGAVLLKAPPSLAFNNRRALRFRTEVGQWWSERVAGDQVHGDPRGVLIEAVERWRTAMWFQGRNRLLYQGASSRLADLAAQAGAPGLGGVLLAGAGNLEETDVADALWSLAHGTGSMPDFIRRYGFHGPNIGDIASRSWREDPGPIERLLGTVAKADDPRLRREMVQGQRTAAVKTLLSELSPTRRSTARALLRIAPPMAQALQNTKTSFLLIMDVARAAARALGRQHVAGGRMTAEEDPFFLFVEEAVNPPGHDLRELVAARRAQHELHRGVTIPEVWTGQPVATPIEPSRSQSPQLVTGLGASSGVVEGVVRVIDDPADDVHIDLGDILVCPITDPSWVSVMTVAGALVIDIGGMASHGAVIARELGVPCVIGTHTGTRDLHDGDTVRVDGANGTVEVLKRNGAAS
ncbi:MAG TPA: PEP-utilizing enzyme [Pseudonocardia sp.]|jgi:pyruvate,water dikinase